VPNTFLANHMPFHASDINDYRRLTLVATPPEKGLYVMCLLLYLYYCLVLINI